MASISFHFSFFRLKDWESSTSVWLTERSFEFFRQFSYSLNEENEMQLSQYQRGSSGKNIMRNIFCCAVVVVCSPFFPLWRTNLCFASVDHCRHHTSSWSSQHQFKFVWETNCMLHSHNGLLYSFFSISLALFKPFFSVQICFLYGQFEWFI